MNSSAPAPAQAKPAAQPRKTKKGDVVRDEELAASSDYEDDAPNPCVALCPTRAHRSAEEALADRKAGEGDPDGRGDVDEDGYALSRDDGGMHGAAVVQEFVKWFGFGFAVLLAFWMAWLALMELGVAAGALIDRANSFGAQLNTPNTQSIAQAPEGSTVSGTVVVAR